MAHSNDPALDTLFLPFQEGSLSWPAGEVLFLRARLGAVLHQYNTQQWLCEQSFKPEADALANAGYEVQAEPTRRFDLAQRPDINVSVTEHGRGVSAKDTLPEHDAVGEAGQRHPLVLLLPPRQRDESRALLARAVASTTPGGTVAASLANNEGARSGEADLEQLIGNLNSLSKHKCRVFWGVVDPARINHSLLQACLQLDTPRRISDARFLSRPGVFAWDRIDPASQLLAQHLPADLSGRAADLGAGFGYLSVELLSRCPHITALDLYEAEARALELARHNLSDYASRLQPGFHWHDVTQGLPQRYDLIISNPPFHTQSRSDRPDIGRRFIAVAAAALAPGGQLWIVANRHLPYEETLNSSFGQVRIVTEQQGFKIIQAIKSPVATSRPLSRRERAGVRAGVRGSK